MLDPSSYQPGLHAHYPAIKVPLLLTIELAPQLVQLELPPPEHV